jgi:peptidoglycan/LPS O-acetylase OafA/YrhL
MQQSLSQNKAKIFFPNLDGLRFISFLVVFLYHSYLSFFSYLKDSSPKAFRIIEFLFQHGNLGVNFFFVLSGFLITYLLIKEKEFTGTIHVGKFYLRRILRIWPLYYLCIFIGFVVFAVMKKMGGEMVDENANPLYYIFFSANFDIMHTWPVKPNALLLSILWSVAVEEQFYLTWPLILRFVPLKGYKFVFPAIIIFSLIFRSFFTSGSESDFAVRYFHTFSLIGDMALGGLFAYFVSYENVFKRYITNLSKLAIVFIYIGTLSVTLFKDSIFTPGIPVIFERFVIAFFFGMIILEQNYAKHSILKMSRLRLFSNLGVYTYGLYCLHFMGIYIGLKLIGKFSLDGSSLWVAIGGTVVALILAIAISLISYHFFEKWFLRLKERFAFIVTK